MIYMFLGLVGGAIGAYLQTKFGSIVILGYAVALIVLVAVYSLLDKS